MAAIEKDLMIISSVSRRYVAKRRTPYPPMIAIMCDALFIALPPLTLTSTTLEGVIEFLIAIMARMALAARREPYSE